MKNIYEVLQIAHIVFNLSLIIYNLKSKIIKKITLIHIISRVRELLRSSSKNIIDEIITNVSKICRVKFT
jgi:hypothetical protein